MAFGLPIDHYSFPPRHYLYEEEEEEEEEEEDEENKLENSKTNKDNNDNFSITQTNSSPKEVNLLLVATSTITVAFIKSHVILKPEPFGDVSCSNPIRILKGRYFHSSRHDNNDRKENKEKISELYEVEGKADVMVVLLLTPLKEGYCNEWSRKILNFTQPKKVIILHSLPLHQYFLSEEEEGEDKREDTLLRSLQTKAWSEGQLVPLLSPSNMITGEPAALLSHCHFSSIPASLTTLYSSNNLTMKEQVTSLRPLLTFPSLHSSLPLVPLDLADIKMESVLPKTRTDMNTLYT